MKNIGRKIVKAAIMTLQSTNANELVTQGLVYTVWWTKRFNYLNRQLKTKDRNCPIAGVIFIPTL